MNWINNIPKELTLEIFSFIPPMEQELKLSLVCKLWKELFENNQERLYISESYQKENSFIPKYFKELTCFVQNGCLPDNDDMIKLAHRLRECQALGVRQPSSIPQQLHLAQSYNHARSVFTNLRKCLPHLWYTSPAQHPNFCHKEETNIAQLLKEKPFLIRADKEGTYTLSLVDKIGNIHHFSGIRADDEKMMFTIEEKGIEFRTIESYVELINYKITIHPEKHPNFKNLSLEEAANFLKSNPSWEFLIRKSSTQENQYVLCILTPEGIVQHNRFTYNSQTNVYEITRNNDLMFTCDTIEELKEGITCWKTAVPNWNDCKAIKQIIKSLHKDIKKSFGAEFFKIECDWKIDKLFFDQNKENFKIKLKDNNCFYSIDKIKMYRFFTSNSQQINKHQIKQNI